jgi:hypothetical protein
MPAESPLDAKNVTSVQQPPARPKSFNSIFTDQQRLRRYIRKTDKKSPGWIIRFAAPGINTDAAAGVED